MKATIEGVEVEGSEEELAAVIEAVRDRQRRVEVTTFAATQIKNKIQRGSRMIKNDGRMGPSQFRNKKFSPTETACIRTMLDNHESIMTIARTINKPYMTVYRQFRRQHIPQRKSQTNNKARRILKLIKYDNEVPPQ